MKNKRAPQPLFQSVSPEGTDWLFFVGSDGDWAITRNGKEFDIGTSEPKSVVGGVKKYFSLIHAAAARDIAADPVLNALLDRIDRGSATAEITKYRVKNQAARIKGLIGH